MLAIHSGFKRAPLTTDLEVCILQTTTHYSAYILGIKHA